MTTIQEYTDWYKSQFTDLYVTLNMIAPFVVLLICSTAFPINILK